MNESKGRLPDFIFARAKDTELENRLLLAGQLVTSIPKWREPRAGDMLPVQQVIKTLTEEARAGRLPRDAIVSIWAGGVKPPNGLEPPFDDDVLESWVAKHFVVVVRVSRDPAGDVTEIDSDLARQMRGKLH